MFDPKSRPITLLILDGWGCAPPGPGNAISLAHTPHLDRIAEKYPQTTLHCSGTYVGLPQGQMGNSEVGHLNIGAGRIVYQDILRISQDLKEGRLQENPVLNRVINKVREGGSIHLMGLVSDGGVHSLQEHLHGLLDILRRKSTSRIFVHCFLDGRDTSPTSGADYVAKLQEFLNSTASGGIATVMGRYYAMDRDKRWDRTQKAYEAMTQGLGTQVSDPVQAIQDSYAQGITDEFIPPLVVTGPDNQPKSTLQDGDGAIFFNFRADRARQLTQALFQEDFQEFQRKSRPKLEVITMTEYDKDFQLPVLFPPEQMDNILGEVLAANSLKQLRISETEKYAHVTYFFNGGREHPFHHEERILIPSPREVRTYDQKPQMSAREVTDTLCKQLTDQSFHLYVCNLANLDMVGHTGSIPAAIRACETVDYCVGRIIETVLEQDGIALLTADHGNADDMLDEYQNPKTAHSTNPVPLSLILNQDGSCLRDRGILADIAPTILDLWSIHQPEEMTGNTLLVKEE